MIHLRVVGESARCTGHCCDPVWYPVPPATLRALSGLRTFGELYDLWIPLHQTVEHEGEIKHLYQCREYEGGQCKIYETRPEVCRRFPPPGTKCAITGCTRKEPASL